MARGSRAKRRVVAYIAAAREVRDHRGNVILSKQDAEDARSLRMARANSFRVSDQTGIGFRV